LFNWLAQQVAGASCLDLFAGSGALGLEALSRGAAHVTFVETAPIAVRELRSRLAEWGADDARVEQADALGFLTSAKGTARRAFDIVFLDPPFSSGLLSTAAALLESGDWLAKEAFVYVETPAGALPQLPPNWVESRAKKAGAVGYHLLTRS
jgi:16S rRNA (guanine966-N2)-methyltransferase